MMYNTLTKIRELVDELYDNTQPHNNTNSMLFLEINQAIDEAQKQCKYYINGTDLDWNDEVQVNDILAMMKQDREENRRIY